MLEDVRDDEWITTGPHRFLDCWCGHGEPYRQNGKTLDFKLDRTHRWVNLGCSEDCNLQAKVHGHVHVHCPECATKRAEGTCCTPAQMRANASS